VDGRRQGLGLCLGLGLGLCLCLWLRFRLCRARHLYWCQAGVFALHCFRAVGTKGVEVGGVWGWDGCGGRRCEGWEGERVREGGREGVMENEREGSREREGGGREDEKLNVRLLVQSPNKNHNRGVIQAF
jgi:hypothetical protein